MSSCLRGSVSPEAPYEVDLAARVAGLAERDWECVGADTRYLTHGIHRYPSKFIPQIARYLIDALCPPGALVLDPFCGSGTTLLEARLAGRRSLGFDRNPLALLIASVKVAPPPDDLDALPGLVADLTPRIKALRAAAADSPTPAPERFVNEARWFQPLVRAELDAISEAIGALAEPAARALAAVALSDAVRSVSNADPDFGNLLIDPHRPPIRDTFERFKRRLIRALDASIELARQVRLTSRPPSAVSRQADASIEPARQLRLRGTSGTDSVTAASGTRESSDGSRLSEPQVLPADARNLPLADASVDACVTHPPYLAAVPYAEYQRLSLQWLRTRLADRIPFFELPEAEPRRLDRTLIGGGRRDPDVAARFETSMADVLAEIARVLKPGAPAAVVIGNPRFRGETRPLDADLARLAAPAGLHLHTQLRRGKYATTMGKLREEFVQVYVRE